MSQELAALGNHTDFLETKHNELSIANSDFSKKPESLITAFAQVHSQVKDLDNCNRCNNLRIRGVPESVTNLLFPVFWLFKSQLPDQEI